EEAAADNLDGVPPVRRDVSGEQMRPAKPQAVSDGDSRPQQGQSVGDGFKGDLHVLREDPEVPKTFSVEKLTDQQNANPKSAKDVDDAEPAFFPGDGEQD